MANVKPEIGSKWTMAFDNRRNWWKVKKIEGRAVYLGRLGSPFHIDEASMTIRAFNDIAEPYSN